jgi:hypothetical protein
MNDLNILTSLPIGVDALLYFVMISFEFDDQFNTNDFIVGYIRKKKPE